MTKRDISRIQEWSYREHAPGAMVPEAGSAAAYETGTWRVEQPIWLEEKCSHCMICWIYCPDDAIEVNDEEKMTAINMFHCKGCGICAKECPRDAIEMVTAHRGAEHA